MVITINLYCITLEAHWFPMIFSILIWSLSICCYYKFFDPSVYLQCFYTKSQVGKNDLKINTVCILGVLRIMNAGTLIHLRYSQSVNQSIFDPHSTSFFPARIRKTIARNIFLSSLFWCSLRFFVFLYTVTRDQHESFRTCCVHHMTTVRAAWSCFSSVNIHHGSHCILHVPQTHNSH